MPKFQFKPASAHLVHIPTRAVPFLFQKIPTGNYQASAVNQTSAYGVNSNVSSSTRDGHYSPSNAPSFLTRWRVHRGGWKSGSVSSRSRPVASSPAREWRVHAYFESNSTLRYCLFLQRLSQLVQSQQVQQHVEVVINGLRSLHVTPRIVD